MAKSPSGELEWKTKPDYTPSPPVMTILSPPLNIQKFTFIHGDSEDLLSKRIKNPDLKAAIRSTVMKRQHGIEAALGFRRSNGRDRSRRRVTPADTALDEDLGSETGKILIQHSKPQVRKHPYRPSPLTTLSPQSFDPFETLPGKNSKLIAGLIKHCVEIFIPELWPAECRNPEEHKTRALYFVTMAHHPKAAFFGHMATVATHRALLREKNSLNGLQDHKKILKDIAYCEMKDATISAILSAIKLRGTIAPETMEACFSIIGAESLIGNFEEVRKHLNGIASWTQPKESESLSQPTLILISTCDIKAAAGMGQPPLFPLPESVTVPLDPDLLSRITPPPDSPCHEIGTKFSRLRPKIPPPLLAVIPQIRILCFFTDYNDHSDTGLTAAEFVAFRAVGHRAEHALVFCTPKDVTEETPTTTLVRLGVLGIMNRLLTVAPVYAGVGRGVTAQQLRALRRWCSTVGPSTSEMEYELALWATFVCAHCAEGQREEEEFIAMLVNLVRGNGWSWRWEVLRERLTGFLFKFDSQLERSWEPIWGRMLRREGKRGLSDED